MLQVKRYDILLVDFGQEAIESEQSGIRPSVVIQNDIGNHYSPTTIVIPLTSQQKNLSQSTHTLIKQGAGKGLTSDSVALAECMRQISKSRIIRYLGKITDVQEKNEIRRIYVASFGE